MWTDLTDLNKMQKHIEKQNKKMSQKVAAYNKFSASRL